MLETIEMQKKNVFPLPLDHFLKDAQIFNIFKIALPSFA